MIASIDVDRSLIYRSIHGFFGVWNLTAYVANLRLDFIDGTKVVDSWKFRYASDDGTLNLTADDALGLHFPAVMKAHPAATIPRIDEVPWPEAGGDALHWYTHAYLAAPFAAWYHVQIATLPIRAVAVATKLALVFDATPTFSGSTETVLAAIACKSQNIPF